MTLSLSPSDVIYIFRPVTRLSDHQLVLTNNGHKPVAFKAKVTNMELYTVKPNLGRVEPGARVILKVTFKGLQEEPPGDNAGKDKLMIQSYVIPLAKERLSRVDLWYPVNGQGVPEGLDASEIHTEKVKLRYTTTQSAVEIPRAIALPLDSSFPKPKPDPSSDENFEKVLKKSDEDDDDDDDEIFGDVFNADARSIAPSTVSTNATLVPPSPASPRRPSGLFSLFRKDSKQRLS